MRAPFVRLLRARLRVALDLRDDLSFERFAFDQFHDIETLTVLLAVMTDARDIRMTDLRGRARFTQENAIELQASSRLFGL